MPVVENKEMETSFGSGGSVGELQYAVVCNIEEQYSIWWADRGLPIGWSATGFVGTRVKCLNHISDIWTDMRPLSLRDSTSAKANPLYVDGE